jgi:hypothetical protein
MLRGALGFFRTSSPATMLPLTAAAAMVALPSAVTQQRSLACTPPCLMLHQTTTLLTFAHWYSGKQKRHRVARDKRYHPKYSVAYAGRNAYSKRAFYKTNRWNYRIAYKDMP